MGVAVGNSDAWVLRQALTAEAWICACTNLVGQAEDAPKQKQTELTVKAWSGCMNLARAHQTRIGWNPERLQFADGSGDPKWLTRGYRGPWKARAGRATWINKARKELTV